MDNSKKDISYYKLYLQNYLHETDNEELSEEFIDARAELAESAYEQSRLEGNTVHQAQERAMSILLQGLDEEPDME